MLKGFLAIVAASLLYGIIPTIQKQVLLAGVDPNINSFVGLLLTCVCSIAIILVKRFSLKVTKLQLAQLILSGVMGMMLTSLLLNSAYALIPVGLSTMLHFFYPTLVCTIMAVLFRQRLTIFSVVSMICSIVGMYLISAVGGGLNMKGIIFAVLSAATFAFYVIGNEKGPANLLPLPVKLFYMSLAGCATIGIYSVITGRLSFPQEDAVWLRLGFSGISYTIAGYFMIAGIKLLGASTASFISMLEPVTSIVFGSIVFRDNIFPSEIVGSILVLISVVFVTLNKIRLEKSTDSPMTPPS